MIAITYPSLKCTQQYHKSWLTQPCTDEKLVPGILTLIQTHESYETIREVTVGFLDHDFPHDDCNHG